MREQWKEHPEFPAYEGSTKGRVRSWKTNGWGRRMTPRIMRPAIRGKRKLYPYLSFDLYVGGKARGVFVHRFIAECFIPNPENKPQINHQNGNKLDNRIENLEWVTNSENQKHAFATGAQDKRGEKHHLAKLTDATVQAIRAESKDGMAQDFLAEKYGVTQPNVSMILSGEHWGHLPGANKRDKRDWRRKLTMDDAREVRRRYSAKEATKAQLAVEYGVTFATISEILAGRRYCELPSGVEYG